MFSMSCQQLTTTISTVLQFAFENDTVRRSFDIVGPGFSFQKKKKDTTVRTPLAC
jgi:hypothetical protein